MKHLLVVLFVIGIACQANAQITIQYSDWQSMMKVGKKVTGYSNQVGQAVTVNIGTASSSSQTFDLTNLNFSSTMSIEYVQPGSSPSISSFPTCNVVQKQTVTLGGQPFLNFAYFELLSSGFSACGYSDESSTPYVSYAKPICNAQFPLTFGKTWKASYESETSISKSVHKMNFKVDAFGKLKLPSGTYDALRVCMVDSGYTTVNGVTHTEVAVSIKYYTKNTEIVEIVTNTKALTSSSVSSNAATYFIPAGSSAVGDNKEIPGGFKLDQNYPNPFNPETTISYKIPASLNPSKGGTLVSLKVFDLLGREVATLVNEDQQAGGYNSQFSIRNFQLTSGVYFYQLKAGDFIETKKMTVMK